MEDDPIITMDDIMKAGHCALGARRWFGEYGLDFRDFMQNGIPASKLLATGDGLAAQVVERKLVRDSDG